MNASLRASLFQLAASNAPGYGSDITQRLVQQFGHTQCAAYQDEILAYLQCLREVHLPTDPELDQDTHSKACKFICDAARSQTATTYTAFRSSFRDQFGTVAFEAFKSRIVSLLRCMDALTTKHYFGRLLLRLRSVKRSDDRTQNRCMLRVSFKGKEIPISEKKVGTNGAFLAFEPVRCREDDVLTIEAFRKCRVLFHVGTVCRCVMPADCQAGIPLGKAFADPKAVDSWHDLGESDGSRVAVRLQLVFLPQTPPLSPSFLGNLASENLDHFLRFDDTDAAATLEKLLDDALDTLYSESENGGARRQFCIDEGKVTSRVVRVVLCGVIGYVVLVCDMWGRQVRPHHSCNGIAGPVRRCICPRFFQLNKRSR